MKTSQIEQTEYQIDKLVKDFKKSMEAISKEKAVIGLSGGIDSAVAAALILKAIGRENFIAVNMPYKPLSQVSSKAAKMVAGKFRLNFETFDISASASTILGLKRAQDLMLPSFALITLNPLKTHK